MTITYSSVTHTRDAYIPHWTLADRLIKARTDFGMNIKDFAAYTEFSMRQIQYAEAGKSVVKDTMITVYAAKTGVDYWWLKTGYDPATEPPETDGGVKLPGLDSNQEPIGSHSANVIRLFRGVPKPPWFLEPSPPDTKEPVRKSQSAQSDKQTQSPKVGPETSNVYYLPIDSFRRAA